MRAGVILALSLLLHLGLGLAQEGERGKRRRGGQKKGRNRAQRQNPDTLTSLRSVPVGNSDDGASVFVESYKNINEVESNYNIIPGRKGQCVYQGITMFDKAVWSPKPCLTCLCSKGLVACDEMACPRLPCPHTVTPAGECCPVCSDLVPVPSVPDAPELSGDFSELNDPSEPAPPVPHTQEQIDQLLRREEQAHREEEERVRKQDAERRRKRRQKKLQAKMQKLLLEERRREEETLQEKMEKEEEERQREEQRRQEEEEAAAERARKQRIQQERRQEEEKRRRRLEMERRQLLRVLEEDWEGFGEREREWGGEGEWGGEWEGGEGEWGGEWEGGEREWGGEWEGEWEGLEREWGERDDYELESDEMWLRGDVFEMPRGRESPGRTSPVPAPRVEETPRHDLSLPEGCVISDVTVSCKNAQFTNIPPLSIPELKALSLEGNEITTIPTGAFNGLPKLEWVNLSKNKITSAAIDPQVFKGLKHLTRLYMEGNRLDHIPPGLPPSLQELKINENNIRGIDENSLQNLPNLITLELEGNKLSEGNVAPTSFLPLVNLSYLRLGRNHFRTVPLGLPAALKELHLENNVIEEISEYVFNRSRSLNIINLRHNRLDETRIAPLAWINHKHLESIDLSHNKLYHVPSFLPRSLVHLVLVGNQIERIPGYVFAHMDPGIEYLYLSFNKLDSEGLEPVSFFGAYRSLSEVFLDHNQLSIVPMAIKEMKSLHFLRLNDNNIDLVPDDAFCDPLVDEDSNLMTLRLENNFIDTRKISPAAFSCIRSYMSVVLQPQKTK